MLQGCQLEKWNNADRLQCCSIVTLIRNFSEYKGCLWQLLAGKVGLAEENEYVGDDWPHALV